MIVDATYNPATAVTKNKIFYWARVTTLIYGQYIVLHEKYMYLCSNWSLYLPL